MENYLFVLLPWSNNIKTDNTDTSMLYQEILGNEYLLATLLIAYFLDIISATKIIIIFKVYKRKAKT